jgi:hypothetical protein
MQIIEDDPIYALPLQGFIACAAGVLRASLDAAAAYRTIGYDSELCG